MKKRKLKDMSDDELDKDILVRENLEVKRKLMRMTEEMEYLRKEMEKLKEEQRDCIVPTMNAKRVAECLPMDMCIELIDEALEDFESKKCQQPLRFGYRLPLKDKKFGILASMPAFYNSGKRCYSPAAYKAVPYCSTKVITVFPSNRKIGKHSHQGVIVLFEAETGEMKAIFDATEITAKRTAAASALATAWLSSPDSTILTLIGSGEQAKTHLEAITIMRRIHQVNIWSRTRSNVDAFVKEARTKYPDLKFVISSSVREACNGADIICTLTASRVPLVTKDMVKPGAHINAVGACTPDMRELSSDLVASAKIIVDDREACMKEPGDIVIPLREGAKVDIDCTIGELLVHKGDQYRHNDNDITIFESVGLAIEDLACAAYLYENFC